MYKKRDEIADSSTQQAKPCHNVVTAKQAFIVDCSSNEELISSSIWSQ
jgi:hypothetical protein